MPALGISTWPQSQLFHSSARAVKGQAGSLSRRANACTGLLCSYFTAPVIQEADQVLNRHRCCDPICPRWGRFFAPLFHWNSGTPSRPVALAQCNIVPGQQLKWESPRT